MKASAGASAGTSPQAGEPAAGIPHDQLIALRMRIIEEGLTARQLAAELHCKEGEVYRILELRPRHLTMASLTCRLGRYLAGEYPATAVNAIILFISVLLAFLVGNAYTVHQTELSDLRQQIIQVQPLAVEASSLHGKALGLQRVLPPNCEVKFETPIWNSVSNAGFLEDEMLKKVRPTYRNLALAPKNSKNLESDACMTFLSGLEGQLKKLEDDLDDYIGVLKMKQSNRRRASALASFMTRDLLAYVGWALALSVAMLLVPVGLCKLGVLTTRAVLTAAPATTRGTRQSASQKSHSPGRSSHPSPPDWRGRV